jgi:hypothetical protein
LGISDAATQLTNPIMAIAVQLKKILSILVLITAFVFTAPDVALGWTYKQPLAAQTFQVWKQDNLTPQEHQELQAIRQSRNREIASILNEVQRRQLEHLLRTDHDLEYAINSLDIDHDQWDTIQAIMQLSALKTKAVLHRHESVIPN